MKNLPDTELVGLLKAGNHTAFEEIYLRYQPILCSYIYRKIKDKQEAEDIVHDVYFNLWKYKEEFAIVSTLSGYLFKATLNKAFSNFRHKLCIREYEEVYMEPRNTRSTDYMIRTNESSKMIDLAISTLPEKMKEVFLLRHKHGLSNKKIADALSLSEHTVATQMKNSLKILRVKLDIIIHPNMKIYRNPIIK